MDYKKNTHIGYNRCSEVKLGVQPYDAAMMEMFAARDGIISGMSQRVPYCQHPTNSFA